MSEDELVERIQRIAWDPAKRLAHAYVPASVVLDHPDDPDTALSRRNLDRADPRVLEKMWISIMGGSLTAIDFYRDAPREPMRPPVSEAQVAEAQRRLGMPLPPLLRRLYTEVGDGGFGPAYGLPTLFREEGSDDWSVVEIVPEDRALGLALCDYGCAIWDFVSPVGPDYLVRHCDTGDDPRAEERKALQSPGTALVTWFEHWLDSVELPRA